MGMPLVGHFALPLAVSAELVLVAVIAIVLLLGAICIGLWQAIGKGPRRNRAYYRARKLLAEGNWRGARLAIQEIREAGVQHPVWAGRVNNLEGECLRRAGDEALATNQYEEALDHYVNSAKLLGLNKDEGSAKVIDGMLGELRAMVAHQEDDKAYRQAKRLLQLKSGLPEAAFWLGLIHLRQGRPDEATQALRAAHENCRGKSVEPGFYLGMHLLRMGQSKEGLKLLADVNRVAGNSVLVSWQLGMGLAMSGGDTAFAIRALQKSLGSDGLPKLARDADRFWQQAFPGESYIAKLAKDHPFVCPVLGANAPGMIRQAKLALGQTLFRADRIADAADVFQDLINEGEPTQPMLRALGISLGKLERYSEAYPHLREAYEQDPAKNPLTACYLALAIAKAKPRRPEDKLLNIREAIRLLVGLSYPVELEPAQLVAAIFAEARAAGWQVPIEEHLRLCNTLVALNATDEFVAAAVDHLAETMPDAVRLPFAFLYGWAARQHGYRGQRDLDLLTRIFQNHAAAKSFYSDRGWNLDAVERLFLERWAEVHRSFPEVLGPDYPERCERALLEEAQRLEEAGQSEAAKATIELLQRLIPPTSASLDQLARLAWHRGEVDEAARLLSQWSEAEPTVATPRARLAMLEAQRGNFDAAADHLRVAYDKSTGEAKTRAALLGARLALKADRTNEALEWLKVCLTQDSNHVEALTMLAALRWRVGDRDGLAELAPALVRSDVAEPHFQYMAAVCRMATGDLDATRESATTLLQQAGWEADAQHLLGVIEYQRSNWHEASDRLNAVVQSGEGPLADHARALLGRVLVERGSYTDAVAQWLALPDEKRQAWGIAESLPGWVYLAGVQGLQDGDELAACQWLDKARELGWSDPRLGPLQERAAVAEARRLMTEGVTAALEPFVPLLERASKNRNALQVLATVMVARVHRQHNRLPEAREVLRRVSPPSGPILFEMGLVALADRQLTAAEELFARIQAEHPDDAAARWNLFWTRLSLGQVSTAQPLLPELIGQFASTPQRRLLTHISTLMKGGSTATAILGDMTAEEEQSLIAALFAIADLQVTVPWLCVLAGARPHSAAAREAQTIGMIRLGKQLFDRGDWLGCEKWLGPLAKARPLASVRNLLGCCLCLQQDFAGGILHLQEALRLAGDDPRLHQNLALAFAWQGDYQEADLCWGRYLGTADRRLPRPPGYIDYHDHLRFHVLRYLGNQAYDREQWNQALHYLSEAHRMLPENVDLAERLFLLQVQAGNREGARQSLTHLQMLRPKHPTYELYELDLIEVRSGTDLERLLDALAGVVERLIDDVTVQDKAVSRVMPQLQARSDQLTRVLRDIREDLQRLPEDSNAWYDALRDLRGVRKDLRRLRQIVRYCAQLQVSEANRHRLDDMTDELDRRIEYCRRWEELD